ncbi:MAG: phosphoribosylanthranilate isomerase [Planctomycetota bacterium]
MIVKICGITNVGDALHSLQVGADWIGLNLVSGPRRIDLTLACRIIRGLADPGRAVVLLNLDPVLDDATLKPLKEVGVHRLQLYGRLAASTHAVLKTRGFEIILAEQIGCRADVESVCARFTHPSPHRPDYVLADARVQGMLGGSGLRADWSALSDARMKGELANWPTMILAGGLKASNVAEAIGLVRPAGVDVSSGVEESPGRKNPNQVAAFVEAVHAREVS